MGGISNVGSVLNALKDTVSNAPATKLTVSQDQKQGPSFKDFISKAQDAVQTSRVLEGTIQDQAVKGLDPSDFAIALKQSQITIEAVMAIRNEMLTLVRTLTRETAI